MFLGGTDAVWKTAQATLRHRLGEARTMRWLGDVSLVQLDRESGRATLEAETDAARAAALAHRDAVVEAIASASGVVARALDLRFTRRNERALSAASKSAPRDRDARLGRLDELDAPDASEPTEAELPVLSLEADCWSPALSLSSFIVGPSNEIAMNFARAVVDAPGGFMNPIVFYGASGAGKTHLLNGIASEYARRHPGRRIAFGSSERFASQFTLATRRREGARFRELWRHADLVVIDDVHLLAGKAMTEQELLHTIDEVVRRKGQIVAASTQPPKLTKLDKGLQGRLIQGLVVELREPDEATRRRLLVARAAEARLDLGDDALDLIARGVHGSARDVLAAIGKVEAHSRLLGARPDGGTARRVLGEILKAREEAPTVDTVVAFVAQELGVDAKAVRGGGRRGSIVRARQVAMAVLRWVTGLTLKEIGAHFGDRSPACVHFAQSRVREMKDEDPKVRHTVEAALRRFRRPSITETKSTS